MAILSRSGGALDMRKRSLDDLARKIAPRHPTNQACLDYCNAQSASEVGQQHEFETCDGASGRPPIADIPASGRDRRDGPRAAVDSLVDQGISVEK